MSETPQWHRYLTEEIAPPEPPTSRLHTWGPWLCAFAGGGVFVACVSHVVGTESVMPGIGEIAGLGFLLLAAGAVWGGSRVEDWR